MEAEGEVRLTMVLMVIVRRVVKMVGDGGDDDGEMVMVMVMVSPT